MAKKVSNIGTNGVGKRRTRMTQSKLEKMLIFINSATAIAVAVVNISLLTSPTLQDSKNHLSVTNTHLASSLANFSAAVGSLKANNDAKEQSPPTVDANSRDVPVTYTVDEKLMRILRHVGIQNASQLSPEDRSLLPTWDQVVERVGNDGPRILGLDTCKAYREHVPQGKRKLGVAGPFSSGTHYLNEVLRKNCKYKVPGEDYKRNMGVWDQVSYD